MDNIGIDKNTLNVLRDSKEPLMIDGRKYTKQNNTWFSEGGYSIEYNKYYFCFLKDGKEHRDNDHPAFIDIKGTMIWYKDGEKYRDNDKPAIIWEDGSMFWYKNGGYHRDYDKPAIIWANGTMEWYKNGELHREEDKPAIISADGTMFWFKDGKKIVKQ